MTNGDYIRSLPDEELVYWVGGDGCPGESECKSGRSCEDCWLEWLRKPREEE